jgi:hypothetical protein
MTATSKILLAAILGAGVSLTPLLAQSDNPNTTNPNTTDPEHTHTYEVHHNTDWGWLGLGGLLGLLGLRRGTATVVTPTRDYGTNRT